MPSPQTKKSIPNPSRIVWRGLIESVQCRAWVWRYKTDNRTHHHLGFNIFIQGRADGDDCRFIVAVSDAHHAKFSFRIGDVFEGIAWPCINAKHDIADFYRASRFRVISRKEETPPSTTPPFHGVLPPIGIFEQRSARLLDARLWRKQCFTCMWANKSAVEIEYKYGKVKRYRKETFCYGPRSCVIHDTGKPREVPYHDCSPFIDDGWMDDL